MKSEFQEGMRIELIRMGLDPDPILAGTQGTIESVTNFESGEIQLGVKWDNGRNLSVILPEDQVKIL